jgi:hypothetical protein
MLILAGAAAIELAGAPLEALLVAARRGADQLPAARAADLLALVALPLAVARAGANGAAAACSSPARCRSPA